MNKGRDFLRSRVNDAVAHHQALLDSMEHHARQAEDVRVRELCNRQLGPMYKRQATLETYQRTLDAGHDLDAPPQDHFLRLVGDVVLARQAEDAFKVFRDAGRELGEMELARIGEEGERDLDRYLEAANRLVKQMFVECAQEVAVGVR
jgi:hypothetical protein